MNAGVERGDILKETNKAGREMYYLHREFREKDCQLQGLEFRVRVKCLGCKVLD